MQKYVKVESRIRELTLKSLALLGVTESKSPLNILQDTEVYSLTQQQHSCFSGTQHTEQALLRKQTRVGSQSGLQGTFFVPLPHHRMRKPHPEQAPHRVHPTVLRRHLCPGNCWLQHLQLLQDDQKQQLLP